jgi:hypothetical protein
MEIEDIKPWDPNDFPPGRTSRDRCTWGGSGPNDPCTEDIKYTVVDSIGRRWSSCESHLKAYRRSRQTDDL